MLRVTNESQLCLPNQPIHNHQSSIKKDLKSKQALNLRFQMWRNIWNRRLVCGCTPWLPWIWIWLCNSGIWLFIRKFTDVSFSTLEASLQRVSYVFFPDPVKTMSVDVCACGAIHTVSRWLCKNNHPFVSGANSNNVSLRVCADDVWFETCLFAFFKSTDRKFITLPKSVKLLLSLL